MALKVALLTVVLFPTIPIGYPNILANPEKKIEKREKDVCNSEGF